MDVILVDNNDRERGRLDKLEAHRTGALHRAYSIFVFNSKKELLIQKRSKNKYHSADLWSNTCCSHPLDNLIKDAEKRLEEEMGFSCGLSEQFSFIYKVDLENGLIEHEFDHVLFGRYDGTININSDEVSDHKWIALDDLRKDIKKKPDKYTYWLKKILDDVILASRTFFGS